MGSDKRTIKGSSPHRLAEILLSKKDLYYRLILSIGLFFIFPAFGFLFFAVKYDILDDTSFPIFLAGCLVFSCIGFMALRSVFRRVSRISDEFSRRAVSEIDNHNVQQGADELNTIVNSFDALESHLRRTVERLEKRGSEISTLKELSDLCYVTFDTEELLQVTLERALRLVRADIGSVLILQRPQKKEFIVLAHIGLGETIKVGSLIDFDTSIAKYAVINKSPLLVEDIENDSRFGRKNRPPYATKSFVCMPLKTIGDIIGVITLSRRREDAAFTQQDVEVLTPLLSNAAFTYENIRLFKENDMNTEFLKTTTRICRTINSSLKDSELLQTILGEALSAIPFDLAAILLRDANRPDDLMVSDFLCTTETTLAKGAYYAYRGSILDKAINQGSPILVSDGKVLTGDLEKELFGKEGKERYLLVGPVRVGGEIMGVIAVRSRDQTTFTKGEGFIDILREALALAAERLRLSGSIVKRNQELDTLKHIGTALASSTFDVDKVLSYAMEMIRHTINVEAGSLLLLQGDELEFKVSFDIEAAKLGRVRIKLGEGIAGHVAAQGKPAIVNDVSQSSLFFKQIDESTGFVTRSVLCLPMISQGKVIGVIELINKRDGDFLVSDEQLLQSIIASLVVAIENARLYHERVSMTEHERGIRHIFQKFVPKQIVDKIIYGEETGKPLTDEFKTLTLLNIDIRGFSKLAKTIGPHRTVPMINYFFAVMGGKVFEHHGIIDKYLGDGFLALFGAPVSSVSDADNAISAAMDMKIATASVSDYFLEKVGVPLSIGITIHTGEVGIGNIEKKKKMDYTVVGDAVNTVFRLQSIVKPLKNGILISEKTLRACQLSIQVKELGEYELDATSGPMKVYELINQLDSLSKDGGKTI